MNLRYFFLLKQNIEALAFSDSICNTYNKSYPFKLHILCSGKDSIVCNGILYYHRPDNYENLKNITIDNMELANFHRCHSGWNVDPGKADFFKFIKALRSCDVFERSLKMREDLINILEDDNVWELLEAELNG